MNVFVSINGLKCGGAEKSLISFLNEIPDEFIAEKQLRVDLLVINDREIFFNNIPKWVNQIHLSGAEEGLIETGKGIFSTGLSVSTLVKILAKIRMRLLNDRYEDVVQHVWKAWKPFVKKREKKYDLAISYVDGFSNYYVVDKVYADRKILWVHNEYDKLSYNENYDRKYFAAADRIITISDSCVKSLKTYFPEFANNIYMIPNLSSPKIIAFQANEFYPDEFKLDKVNILSVGRLSEQKGFDLAIDSAKIIKEHGIDFVWIILGEGELRESLQNQIDENGLADYVMLLGTRSNPYPYMKNCNVFIQPSRYEGKSIVLDEVKILERPIVVTDYETVNDSITNGINGIIASFDAKELANAIINVVTNQELQNKLVMNLQNENSKFISEIDKYLELF